MKLPRTKVIKTYKYETTELLLFQQLIRLSFTIVLRLYVQCSKRGVN